MAKVSPSRFRPIGKDPEDEAVKKTVRTAMAAALAILALAAGARAEDANFAALYADNLFSGSVEVVVTLPDGETEAMRGRASAEFVDLGEGRLRLLLNGRITDEDDASVVLEGAYDATGWRGESEDGLVMTLAADGAVTGGGDHPGRRFDFTGTLSPDAFDLAVEIVHGEANEAGLPPGTTFGFSYALTRTAVPETEAGSGDRECARIVWQFRNIATFGGGMQMIQVPVCMSD